MTLILEQSQALAKERYAQGLPKLLYQKKVLKCFQSTKRKTDFGGRARVAAVQNENPQGIGPDIETALGSLRQGNYLEWSIPRRRMYAVARVTGEALRALKGDENSFVDAWKNECDGVVMQLMQDTEIAQFRDSTGVLGQISAASDVGTATITLEEPADIVNFTLNQRLQAVSDRTLSPTRRVGAGVVTAIDRLNGTLTVATSWSGEITAVAAGDYLCRYGFAASAGTPTCIDGYMSIVAGGTTPGTLNGLNRDVDPVRLAGQVVDVTDQAMDEAIIDSCARVSQQGGMQPTTAWVNPRNLANWKKSHQGRITYQAVNVMSRMAAVSFRGIQIEGDDGEPVTILSSPFCPINQCTLTIMDDFTLDTLGPACGLLDEDGQSVTRTPTSDAYEMRFATYGNHYALNLINSIRLTGFGQLSS